MTGADAVAPARDLLVDAFERIRDLAAVVRDDAPPVLSFRPAPDANTIAWLLWHQARVQDSHIAELAAGQQVWIGAGWVDRFQLPLDPMATGYDATPEEVAALDRASAELLAGYHADVHEQTMAYLAGIDADELGRVVDRSWDPPVTASARLVSVIGDCLQHLGQAGYLRGLAGG